MGKTAPIVPFLKWAGGKRWLLSQRPELFQFKYRNYIEPFLGSGAVYFHLQPGVSELSDANPHLIETYQAIRQDWDLVYAELQRHHSKHSREYYYSLRSKHFRLAHKRAAQFIYLNRTCWNGLYRVNKKGEFNVPMGTKTNVLLDTDNFESVSRLLKRANLSVSDFEALIDRAEAGDLIFADPPYTVKHKYNGFVKYNETLFSWDDQIRLAESLSRARDRKAKIILTNADHQSILDLYSEGFSVTRISRSSVIAASSARRGRYSELLITANL